MVNNSRTWLRLVPSVRVITRHIALRIQNLHTKHTKSLNKTLYYLIRSTYTSTQVRPRYSPLPRNTCKQQQFFLIFNQNICTYHKNRKCILYTIQFIATTKAVFRSLHLNLRFTRKRFVIYTNLIIHILPYKSMYYLQRQLQKCKIENITILK